MGLESQVYAQLAATSELTDEVAARIYRFQRERGSALPSVAYQRVTSNTSNHSTGATTTRRCTFQVDSYADDLGEVRTVADAVETALGGWSNPSGTPSISMSHLQSDLDIPPEPEQGTDVPKFRISQDYELWYGV